MADGITVAAAEPAEPTQSVESATKRAGLLRRSWFSRITLIYWLSRLVSVAIVLVFAWFQGKNYYSGAHPDYITFANFWDARWYQYIASAGYPGTLPIDSAGHVQQNSWAFLPVYPFLVGGLAAITGLSWSFVAVVVSFLSGWGFALVFYRVMRHRLNATQSTWAVVFACVAPVSPLFGFAYAEAFFLFLLAIALLLLLERSYWMLALLIPIMAFTRPGVIAFGIVFVGHWLLRWWNRREDPFPMRERIEVFLLTAWSGICGIAWIFIAGFATGQSDAYTATELSWRAQYIGFVELFPGAAWFQSGNWWLGQPLGTIVPLLLMAGFAGMLFLPSARRLGTDLRLWLAGYGIYTFLFFFPQSSTFRILAPMFPVTGMLAQIRSRLVKVLLVLLSIAAQVGWLYIAWAIIGYDWSPP